MILMQYNTLEEMTDAASDLVISEIQKKANTLICAATGKSPTGTYKKVVEKKARIDIDGLHFIKLDEWYGLPVGHNGTCEYYLQHHLLKPLGIKPAKYTGFVSEPASAEAECERIQNFLTERGPIDLCILGIGMNGHIAFNEPADELHVGAHLSKLSEASLKHSMVEGANKTLEYGLTLGMGDILQSRKILLIVNGQHKREILNKLLTGNITTQLPASFLWLHTNVYCYFTEEG